MPHKRQGPHTSVRYRGVRALICIDLLASSIGNTFREGKLSRYRVEIFRQGKVGYSANLT